MNTDHRMTRQLSRQFTVIEQNTCIPQTPPPACNAVSKAADRNARRGGCTAARNRLYSQKCDGAASIHTPICPRHMQTTQQRSKDMCPYSEPTKAWNPQNHLPNRDTANCQSLAELHPPNLSRGQPRITWRLVPWMARVITTLLPRNGTAYGPCLHGLHSHGTKAGVSVRITGV